jgi:hypothetical protein
MSTQLMERLPKAGSEHKLFGRIDTDSCKKIWNKFSKRIAVGITIELPFCFDFATAKRSSRGELTQH